MRNFKTSVETQIETTKGEIIKTYGEFKKCADDNPCCETNETTVKNWYTSMENYQRAIYKRLIAIKELEARVKEIEVECWEELEIPNPLVEPAPVVEEEPEIGKCYMKFSEGCAAHSGEEYKDWVFMPGRSTPWMLYGFEN